MTSPFIPCPFQYNDMPQGGQQSPMIVASRDPSATDLQYIPGYFWLSDVSQGGTGSLFVQSGFSSGVPLWVTLSAGVAGALNTLSNGTTIVPPFAGNIAIKGTANEIDVTSSPGTNSLIISLSANITFPGVLNVGGALNVTGATTLSSTLAVTGATTLSAGLSGTTATFSSTLHASGATTLGSTLVVTGATTLSSTLAAGNTTITGTLGVSGAVTFSSTVALIA